MEYLQTWLDNSEIPIITAFLLGLLTAVSPCPLATNITAIGFISKDINNRNRIFTNGVLYTLGRVLAYSALGLSLIHILKSSRANCQFSRLIQYFTLGVSTSPCISPASFNSFKCCDTVALAMGSSS